MKLTVKLFIWLFINIFLILVIGFMHYNAIKTFNNEFINFNHETIPTIWALKDMKSSSLRVHSSTAEYSLINLDDDRESSIKNIEFNLIRLGRNDFEVSLNEYKLLVYKNFKDEIKFYEKINASWIEFDNITSAIILSKEKNDDSNELLILREMHEMSEERLLESIDEASKNEDIEVSVKIDNVNKLAVKSQLLIGIIIFIILAISILVWVNIYYTITKPFHKFKLISKEIINGNFKIRSELKSNDEFERLSNLFDSMMEYIDKSMISVKDLDLTVSKRTNELETANLELKKLDYAKDNFLSMISHELRTPLTVIRSHSQIIKDGYLGKMNKKQKESLKIIIHSTDNLTNIINNILDVSKYETGKMTLLLKEENINIILKTVIVEFNPLIKRYNGKIRIKLLNEYKIFNIDEYRFKQIFRNIISNSIKYRSNKRRLIIEITLKDSDTNLLITIKDNGIGMNDENLKQLFNKFYQVEKSLTKRLEGTGLGLVITNDLVKEHKGKIKIKSKENVGTTVEISLPFKSP